MLRRALVAALAAALLTPVSATISCDVGSQCPEDSPCCSAYNVCGVGAFCLGGCDVRASHDLKKYPCHRGPVCKDATYKLNSLDDVQSIDKYLGDASDINWQSQGKPVIYEDSLLLTMAEGTVGTLLASTHYVWYGKICAKMTTSQGKGVVTAFIMMSDVKDEIDFEFIGVDIDTAQSNFYSQGVTVYTNSANLTVENGNTVEKLHEYCIDWKPDQLDWYIDGDKKRTLMRKDTWNKTSDRFDYPQTPSRVMLSLWPAGLPSNAKGTIDWAGGEIDWNSPYMQNGYYYARVSEVTVECYDPPPMVQKKGSKVYKYTDLKATNNTIEISDDLIILGSLYATGEDPDFGATTASNAPKPTKSVETVPGGNPGGGNRDEGQSSAAAAVQATASGGADSPAATGASDNGAGGGQDFVQNAGGEGSGSSLVEPGLGRISGSALAIVVAVLGLVVV
ncbi:glycoside hydrolase family 16 protein [Lojkania enalia]|uniref:Glycoside hydrolase family 16 protein n=1 Tax=Lojkania enalia TaxID=147567 RepID=A0A9P4K877_9PLEO|nr:glycoside hydrolase family 16 protein [Didymosphaeria enalia]